MVTAATLFTNISRERATPSLKTQLLLILSLLATFGKVLASSPIEEIHYRAESALFSDIDSLITLSGNATLTYQTITIFADTIFYSIPKQTLLARGNPVLIDREDTLVGDYIAYNIAEQRGRIRHGEYHTKDSLLFYGRSLAVDSTALYIKDGFYTTSLSTPPQYRFFSPQFKLIPDDVVIAKPFVLEIQESPVFAIPFFISPLDDSRNSGWLQPRWGVGINGSGSVDNIGYYWAFNDYIDLFIAGKVDNFTGFQVKSESSYHLKDRLRGRIGGSYAINDRYMGSSRRWDLNFQHDQTLLPDGTFTLQGGGSVVSDRSYYSDFSQSTEELLNRDVRAQASLNKRLPKLGGHTSLSWSRNHNLMNETIRQDLPTFRFSLQNRSLFEGADLSDDNFLKTLRLSYTLQARQTIFDDQKKDIYTRDAGVHHTLPVTGRFTLFNYITVTPTFTVQQSLFNNYYDTTSLQIYDTTVTLYDTLRADERDLFENQHILIEDSIHLHNEWIYLYNSTDSTFTVRRYDTLKYGDRDYSFENASMTWWTSSLAFQTKLYGHFPLQIGNFQGIRHTLTPNVTYTYTPEVENPHRYPSVVPSVRGTERKQTATISLGNTFHGRIEESPTRSRTPTLLTLNASGSYNFESKDEKWSTINLQGGIPHQRVSLNYSGRYTPYNSSGALDIPQPLRHQIQLTPRLPQIRGSLWSGDLFTLYGIKDGEHLGGLNQGATPWQLSLSPSYNYILQRTTISDDFSKSENYNLSSSFSFQFSHRWNLKWSGNWSFTEHSFINQSVSLYGDLNSWDLRFNWYPTGVNSGRFYMIIAIKRHRDIKWEQREK